eukprot:9009290-Heterocapsa_arctica.AAC.1
MTPLERGRSFPNSSSIRRSSTKKSSWGKRRKKWTRQVPRRNFTFSPTVGSDSQEEPSQETFSPAMGLHEWDILAFNSVTEEWDPTSDGAG